MRFSINFLQQKQPTIDEKDDFDTIMHLLVIVLSELNAGCIEFQDVLGVRR